MDMTSLISAYDKMFNERWGNYLNDKDSVIAAKARRKYDLGLEQVKAIVPPQDAPRELGELKNRFEQGGFQKGSDLHRELVKLNEAEMANQGSVRSQLSLITEGAAVDVDQRIEQTYANIRKKRMESPGQRASLIAPKATGSNPSLAKRTLISGY